MAQRSDPTAAPIGTTLTAVGPAVAAGKSRVLLGLRCTNPAANGAAISATVVLRRATVDTPIIPGTTIRLGGAIEGMESGKMVMQAGDQLFARSSLAASLHVIPSYDESDDI